MKIIFPFHNPEKYPLTQKFGAKFLYGGKTCSHKGVDYAMPRSTQIIAPFDCVVTRITPDRTVGYGKAVYVRAAKEDKDKIEAMVAHLSEINVQVGYKVKTAQILGSSGRTGFWRGVNGYHLHFGIRVNNHYIDPLPLLKVKEKQADTLFNQDDSKLKSFLGSYTVQKGDSLWKISEKYYNNGGHYNEIFNANMDVIENIHLIYPGQVLRIPVLKNLGL